MTNQFKISVFLNKFILETHAVKSWFEKWLFILYNHYNYKKLINKYI